MSTESTPALTEQHNLRSADIDGLSAREVVGLFAVEDRRAVEATVAIADDIARAVEWDRTRGYVGTALMYDLGD